ncbi:N-glycosylase/DNA lyase OGG1 [Dictyocoela muelleri]|nr:N-glycosylase/DNA lyase OGG1 [Dictyocoela muelleri]
MLFYHLPTNQYINLKLTLFSGQIFNFQKTGENMYSGVIRGILFTLKQEGTDVYYKIENYDEINNIDINFNKTDNITTNNIDFNKIDINKIKNNDINFNNFKTNKIKTNNSSINDKHSKLIKNKSKYEKLQKIITIKKIIKIKSIKEKIKIKRIDKSTIIKIKITKKKESDLKNSIPDIDNINFNINNISFKIFDIKRLAEKILSNFFTLDIDYEKLFNKWKYPWLPKIEGLRLLSLEQIPTIFSFICSANNNIKRITKMVNFIYSQGNFIKKINGINFYHFPELVDLIDENLLRGNMFGYRSRYIVETAKIINNNFKGCNLNENDLNKLMGVGRKVRDCIRLLSMNKLAVVPVDTHIFKISKKIFNMNESKLTVSVYKKIQEYFYDFFGEYAGIAQLMFFGDSIKLTNY